MRRMRIGVVGLGFGAAVHVPGLRMIPGVEVVAIAGRRKDKAEARACSLGVPSAFSSVEALLDEQLDAVTLALPPLENERACRIVIDRRIPVLSEKPLACTRAAAVELASLARGIPNAVDFQFVELECFSLLKRVVADRDYGTAHRVKIEWTVESYAQRNRLWSWKTDESRCGGVITLLGSHLLFLLEWIFGPIESVAARADRETTRRFTPAGALPAEDRVDLQTTHCDGVVVCSVIGNASPNGVGHRWEIEFDRATVTLENPGPDYMSGFRFSVTRSGHVSDSASTSPAPETIDRVAAFSRLAGRFLNGVQRGAGVWPDFRAAARVQALIEALRDSDASRSPVRVQEDSPSREGLS